MTYDPNVPLELKDLQTWFSGVITQPLDRESHIASTTPSGIPIKDEAKRYIVPSPTLESQERIEIYNQQYWWRLFNALHDTFLLATRLLGYQKFNEMVAIPYLAACPSSHWSLAHLGNRLPLWMKEHYKGEEKELLYDSILIDAAINTSFFEPHYPSISSDRSPEEVFSIVFFLQPHIFLFHFNYDLLRFRNEIKQNDPDFWSNHHYPSLKHALSEIEQHFPKLKKGDYYFIIYRAKNNKVMWDDVSATEYLLLNKFKEGSSIEQCIQILENGEKAVFKEALKHFKDWVQKWISHQWLTSTS